MQRNENVVKNPPATGGNVVICKELQCKNTPILCTMGQVYNLFTIIAIYSLQKDLKTFSNIHLNHSLYSVQTDIFIVC